MADTVCARMSLLTLLRLRIADAVRPVALRKHLEQALKEVQDVRENIEYLADPLVATDRQLSSEFRAETVARLDKTERLIRDALYHPK